MTTTTTKPPLFVLYGSATGNAEHIAKDLAAAASESAEYSSTFDSVVCYELDQWKKKCAPIWDTEPPSSSASFHSYPVLIVTSTTGNGDAPENAGRFVRYAKRKGTADSQPFRHITYAVLALGDTNYDQFCATGKLVDRKCLELGGRRCRDVVCADEATGLEDVVEPWTQTILTIVAKAACTTKGNAEKEDVDAEEATKEETAAEDTVATKATGSTPAEPPSAAATTNGVEAPSADVTTDDLRSMGAKLVQSLAGRDVLLEVDAKLLPSMGVSDRLTCELVVDDAVAEAEIAAAVAEGSDDDDDAGYAYSAKAPYESRIEKARYLTQTSIAAAEACRAINLDDDMATAVKLYDDVFPLTDDKDESSRNGKRVLELTLGLPDDQTFPYTPGDSLGMLVENDPSSVQFCLDLFAKHSSSPLLPSQYVKMDGKPPVTVQHAVQRSIDLCSPVKGKRILYALSRVATNAHDRTSLQLLASKGEVGEKLYTKLVDDQRWTIVDLLQLFPSCQSIDPLALLSLAPATVPRYYSVASSPLVDPTVATIAFSVVDYVTPSLLHCENDNEEMGRRRIRGVCTRLLETMASSGLATGNGGTVAAAAGTVRIFPKPTQEFTLPESLSTPLVLIGPGTGVAPFLGFLQHRMALRASNTRTNGGGSVGSVDVFFGCRHADHDCLYKDELQAFVSDETITKLYTALSRDGPSNHKYVQDIMLNDADCGARLTKLILDQGAVVYVCGDGNNMAKDVQTALVTILQRKLGDGTNAKKYLADMKSEQRFLLDIWS